MESFPRIEPLSEQALAIRFGADPDAATGATLWAFADSLRQQPLAGQRDVVPAFTTLSLHFDPARVRAHWPHAASPLQAMAEAVRRRLEWLSPSPALPARAPVEIPVRYGGALGPDLRAVARHAGLTEAELIELHSGQAYTVYLIGFLPGFPYLGFLPEALVLPRRATPRTRVPAGSVAIAGRQTGIYPQASPGGWHLLGHTEFRLFDPLRPAPALLQPGQRVTFVPV
ncbi:MAG: 5-oxoprolinase subunit PxpB [Saprospiraceae bacterium]|nr:5-oxoprolinase subunit PxpB [Saprospiraceae bacterium]